MYIPPSVSGCSQKTKMMKGLSLVPLKFCGTLGAEGREKVRRGREKVRRGRKKVRRGRKKGEGVGQVTMMNLQLLLN